MLLFLEFRFFLVLIYSFTFKKIYFNDFKIVEIFDVKEIVEAVKIVEIVEIAKNVEMIRIFEFFISKSWGLDILDIFGTVQIAEIKKKRIFGLFF